LGSKIRRKIFCFTLPSPPSLVLQWVARLRVALASLVGDAADIIFALMDGLLQKFEREPSVMPAA
jgi:hypothetical protein